MFIMPTSLYSIASETKLHCIKFQSILWVMNLIHTQDYFHSKNIILAKQNLLNTHTVTFKCIQIKIQFYCCILCCVFVASKPANTVFSIYEYIVCIFLDSIHSTHCVAPHIHIPSLFLLCLVWFKTNVFILLLINDDDLCYMSSVDCVFMYWTLWSSSFHSIYNAQNLSNGKSTEYFFLVWKILNDCTCLFWVCVFKKWDILHTSQ